MTSPTPKIVILSPFAPPEVGANVERVSHFQSYFSAAGLPTEIWSPARGKAAREKVWRYAGMRSFLHRLVKDPPSIVIGTSPPMTHAAIAALFCFFWRIPFILDIRDPWPDAAQKIGLYSKWNPKYWVYKIIEHTTYLVSTQVWVVNSFLKRWVSAYAPPSRVHVIGNGTQSNQFNPSTLLRKKTRKQFSIPAEKCVILFLGDFSSHGLEDFLTATLPIINDNGAMVILATAFTQKKTQSAWEDFFATHGFSNYRLINLPPLSKEEVSATFAMADWGVSLVPPALSYMIPVKTYDYLANGLFVIGRGPLDGGLYDFVNHHKVGRFVSTNGEAAHVLNQLFHRPAEWKKIAAHNRELAPLFERDIQAALAVGQLKKILK